MMVTAGYILTVLAYVLSWLSFFCASKKKMLVIDNVGKAVFVLAFACQRAWNGVQSILYSFVRNLCAGYADDKSAAVRKRLFAVFLLLLLIMYGFCFQGWRTIVMIIFSGINLYGVMLCSAQGRRLACIAGSGFYIAYYVLIGNVPGVLCEAASCVCSAVSFVKYRKTPCAECAEPIEESLASAHDVQHSK